ncbi:MAG: energy-coupling factor transporter transmembrane protein EcfT [Thaumarchaeota archaeon]|nr:energy-coupling factor transporter transmembrane protein EcfT [Nitrososphaerota archaeon]
MFFVANVFAWSTTFNHPLYTGLLLAIVLGVATVSRTLKDMKFALIGMIIIASTSVVLWPLFRRQGTIPIFSIGPVIFYVESLLYGAAVGLRLIAMILSGLVLLTTTKIEELEAGLTKLGMPYPMAFATSAVFRFIPTMMGDAQMVLAAQQARGVDLLRGSIINKMKNSAYIIIPLFTTTLRRFGELPMAIESRGFVPFAKRSYMIELRFRGADWFVVFASLALTILFIYLRLNGYGAILPSAI